MIIGVVGVLGRVVVGVRPAGEISTAVVRVGGLAGVGSCHRRQSVCVVVAISRLVLLRICQARLVADRVVAVGGGVAERVALGQHPSGGVVGVGRGVVVGVGAGDVAARVDRLDRIPVRVIAIARAVRTDG